MHRTTKLKMKAEAAARREEIKKNKADLAENERKLAQLEAEIAANEAIIQELRDRQYNARKEAESVTGDNETDLMTLLFLLQETCQVETALKMRGEG